MEPQRRDIKQLTMAVMQLTKAVDRLVYTVEKLVISKTEEQGDQADSNV